MTELVQGAVSLFLLGVLALARQFILARQTPLKLSQVGEFARVAVNAAERLGIDTDAFEGADKYDYAAEALQELAARVGISLSDHETNALVHAALNELRHFDVPQAAAPPLDILDWLATLDDGAGVDSILAEEPLTPTDEPRQGTLTLVESEDTPAG